MRGHDTLDPCLATAAEQRLLGRIEFLDERAGLILGKYADSGADETSEAAIGLDLSEAQDLIALLDVLASPGHDLSLARALVNDPDLLLLDEPTTGLDPRSRIELWEAIRGLVADGTDVLLTTQYLEEADQLARDVVIIDHGKVIASGTPDELKTMAGNDVIEVRPRQATDLDAVRAILAEVAAEDPRVTHLVLLGSGGGMTQADELTLLVRRNPGYLGIRTEEDLAARFAEVFYYDELGAPHRRGERTFYTRKRKDQEKAVLYTARGAARTEQVLLDAGLIDELRLVVAPVVLGAGRRFFRDGATPTGLALTSSQVTPSGLALQTYQVTGRPQYGVYGEVGYDFVSGQLRLAMRWGLLWWR